MPATKISCGRVIGSGVSADSPAGDGSQDTSAWAILTTSDIASTSDPNNLETSKSMSGNEFQFRGTAPVGSNLDNPNDGCLYRFALKDPATGAALSAGSGDVVGVEFYFQFGTNVPNAQNEMFFTGVYDGGTQGSFAGFKRDSSQTRLSYGSYTSTSKQAFTHSSNYAYRTSVLLADDSADASAVAGLPAIVVFDDPGSPARVGSAVSGSQTTTIAAGGNLALVFAGDVDVTVYYRLVFPPSSPF
jgi:hypothetical protein